MKAKYVALVLLMMLLLGGCATMNVELTDPTGRKIPNPHYVLQSINDQITVTFYYAKYETIDDLDGTLIGKPVFLDLFTVHDIFAEKYKRVTLTIEIRNPNQVEYSLYERIELQVGDMRREAKSGGEIGKSNLPYRQFLFQLPYGEDVRYVDHHVSLDVNGDPVIQMGSFKYNLIH